MGTRSMRQVGAVSQRVGTAPGAKSRPRTSVKVRALGPDDWPVLERLFGANGACGGCWCMWWRVPRGGKTWEERKGERNRRDFKRLVASGTVHGCLAFQGDEPIGWCCVGPRTDFPRVERVKGLRPHEDDGTWSLTCFFVRSGWRGKGVASALLRKAVQLARQLGARELEGYPVRPRGSAAIPAAFAWTGVPALFEAQQFVPLTPPGATRDTYVRRMRSPT